MPLTIGGCGCRPQVYRVATSTPSWSGVGQTVCDRLLLGSPGGRCLCLGEQREVVKRFLTPISGRYKRSMLRYIRGRERSFWNAAWVCPKFRRSLPSGPIPDKQGSSGLILCSASPPKATSRRASQQGQQPAGTPVKSAISTRAGTGLRDLAAVLPPLAPHSAIRP